MQALLDVILPVFLVIGFGYLAVWRGWFSDSGVDGVMRFTQTFAIPCLLFGAIAQLDLSQSFDPALLISFYTGALTGFIACLFGARFLFHRPWADSVAIGFLGLFSNSVLLGLPITERAFGPDALDANFAIIALHAPFCYGIGVTVMEVVRARGQSALDVLRTTLNSMFHNALILGIAAGFVVNLAQLPLPGVFWSAVDLMVAAALPVALFGLGGVLTRYRPTGDLRISLFVCLVSLILHPSITFGLATLFELPTEARNSAVVTAAMAPGINSYIFASLYGVALRVSATTVLIATALSMITAWGWLSLLGS